MIRHAAAAAVALCLSPSWLSAQGAQFVVKTPSASVHKAPTTASPVVATARRGAVLEVTRDLGSWMKVTWPDAPDGVGYVHVSMVTTANAPPTRRSQVSAPAGTRAMAEPAPAQSTYRQAIDAVAQHGSVDAAGQYPASDALYFRPPAHVLGLGGRMNGSTLGYGISARAWPRRHLGVQIDVSRYALTSPGTPARLTSLHFAPSVLYRLSDRVTDYVWVRPYFGAGANLQRQNLGAGVSDTSLGYQAFGGGEFTFATVPRFALGVDAGYRWSPSPLPGFDFRGMAFSVAGHWYFK